MLQLSIVIPAFGSDERLEATLVSVLENRPRDSEVIVALDRPYADPYELAGEVRFVVDRAGTIAGAVAAAIRQSRAPVVHVIAAGVSVDEGWTEQPLEHFHDSRIAAVAPLVLSGREVCSTGIEYSRGGRRVQRNSGAPLSDVGGVPRDVLGPSYLAGFYRREALMKLPHAFDAAVSDALIDVDTALQLRTAGYRAVFEPRSMIYLQDPVVPTASAVATGRGAERLFRRHAPQLGRASSWVAHLLTIVGELFTRLPASEKCGRLLGRLAATGELGSYVRFHLASQHTGRPGLAFAVTTTGDRIRIDGAHPRPTTSAKPQVPADRRSDGSAGRSI